MFASLKAFAPAPGADEPKVEVRIVDGANSHDGESVPPGRSRRCSWTAAGSHDEANGVGNIFF
ncbi:hypothetical protein [Singulisphaera acidiphila]|uniref:Uncharacterized protein n=1 Tax=Singulisphaera acidiphila (strain ATCC BAA-1392 / DSM 18658 / VKM B-2454 / MOB10) TaxID=886293 RepID=L0DI12_SINAD|nr:hypothetical protein [Singulisphaera acidiphila]AGA28490.1 hypothetical protein Sinac_4291 [Singulisphaera acidiphila DSM 18658]